MTSEFVVDTSAVIAILNGESGSDELSKCIMLAAKKYMSTLSLLEASLVASAQKGEAGYLALESLLRKMDLTMMDLSVEQVELVQQAWMQFGESRHPAKLNLGDTGAYALAKQLGLPILCVGNDFAQTDIKIVKFR
ncbi:MAG: type II toxin-antitoxin system VapC family toxin [Deltaproteobacteria bacterium]|nr:type II toxin-antitoxin system VapC family toxin [Deltaproteobacteria bacterium]